MNQPSAAAMNPRTTGTSTAIVEQTGRTPEVRPKAFSRRGVLLLLVLMTSLIVSIIAFGGLMVQRIQLLTSQQSEDVVDARWAGRSALAVAAKRIDTDENWRNTYTSGPWLKNIAEGSSTWHVSGIDPADGDLTDQATDPLQLTGTGDQNLASQHIRLSVQPATSPVDSLSYAIYSEESIWIFGGQIHANGWVGSNGSITATTGAMVDADVSAGQSIVGGPFAHRTVSGALARQVPAMSDIDFHVGTGTRVAVDDFQAATYSGVNLIRNGGLDSDVGGWSAYPSCSLTHHPIQGLSNSGHMELHSRASADDAALYDITNAFYAGESLQLEAYVMPETTTGRIRFSIVVETIFGAEVAATYLSAALPPGTSADEWNQVTATLTPFWFGRMKRAWLAVTTSAADPDPAQDVRIDNVSLALTGTPFGDTIYRSLITPDQSPFGVSPNPWGIYVIDCAGRNIQLRDSRINGTLVFLNATNGVTIESGAINWTTTSPNLPALVVDGPLTIRCSRFSLDERRLDTNFNPAGSPDRNFTTDNDTSDRYASRIDGLVYASGDVVVSGDVACNGGVLCGGHLTIIFGVLSAEAAPWKHGKPVSGFDKIDDLVTPNGEVFERVFN